MMDIIITKQAKSYMKKFHQKGEHWLIAYEKSGCTCAEEGVFSLRLVTAIDPMWVSIHTDVGSIYMAPKTQLYLDDVMKIEYQEMYHDLSFKGKYAGLVSSHFIIQNEDGTQRHL